MKLDSDAHHCGACANDCGLGACESGVCTPEIVASDAAYAQIAADDDAVYWLSRRGELNKLPHTAKLAEAGSVAGLATVLAVEVRGPTGLALDASNVYFTWDDAPQGTDPRGQIIAIPKTSGEPTKLALGRTSPSTMAIDGDTLYWIEVNQRRNEASVVSLLISRGVMNGITTLQPAPTPTAPQAIAVSASHVYWNNADRQLREIVTKTGEVLLVSSTTTDIAGIGVDGDHLYWVDASQGLMRLELGSTQASVIDAGSGADTLSIAGDNVFWSSAQGIRVVAKSGTPAPALLTNFRAIWLAVTSQWIYGSTGNTLWRLKRSR